MKLSTEKENQRVRLTKTMFKNALVQLLSKKKLCDITIQELCDKAELNRTTFYKHYKNIRDILDEIENETLHQSKLCMEQISTEKEVSIISPLYHFLCHIKEHADTYRLLLNPNNDFNNKLLTPALDFLNEKSKNLHFISNNNTTYIYEYILSGSMTLIRNWLFSNTTESPEFIASLIYETALKLMK